MKRSVVAFTLALAACCAVPARAALTLVDDGGRRVTLSAPARRVVALAPNLVEMVEAVGAGAAIAGSLSGVGVTTKGVAVGDAQRLDVERIVALKPDLVLVWRGGNNGRELEQLAAAGLALFALEPRRLAEVPRAIERIGTLFGREAAARTRAKALRDELAGLRARYAAASPVRVYYQVWANPPMTLNHEHLISEVITLCGGRNVFAGLAQLVPQVSAEAVVAADPQVMLTAREQSDGDLRWHRAPDDPAFAAWRHYHGIAAVRGRWLFTLPGDAISRQGPAIADGVRAVCEALDTVRAGR